MKILVTGANGFIGKNLCLRARYLDDIEVVKFDLGDDFSVIEDNITEVDALIHLAGVNRPEAVEDFYQGNAELTGQIVSCIQRTGAKPTILFSSSIQTSLENDYGKSKRMAEDALLALKGNMPVYIFRLHNVFGKWCRPNYNSVVATYCYNILHDIPINVSDPDRLMELVYVDDVVTAFIKIAGGAVPMHSDGKYYHVQPVYKLRLKELADIIKSFKQNLDSTVVPNVGDIFTKKLFSTYVSYVENGSDITLLPTIHTDHRGSFTEVINTQEFGQVSVSISKPGVTRGNHWHDTKVEKFIVLSGTATIRFRHMMTGHSFSVKVKGEEQQIVTIPTGYTHSIENTGNSDMLLLIWGNENFNPNRSDTYFEEV